MLEPLSVPPIEPKMTMPIRLSSVPRFLAFAVFVCALLLGGRARADEASEAQDYVEKQNNRIAALLRQPASAQRDAQITGLLNGYIAYDEVTHRAFGEPCPTAKPCEDHWKALTDPQKTEVADLLKRLVEKNYRKNLIKTLDWEISYKSSKESRDGEYRVKTEAKNKTKPRDPSVQVPGQIVAMSLDHALGVHGQPLVRLVQLERGHRGAPVVGVGEAPGRRVDADPAAPHGLLIGGDRGHPGFVVGGLDRGRVAEAGLVINAQPHVSASPR